VRRALPALLALLALLAGCGGAAGHAPPAGADLNVFAAASLTESFGALASGFEKTHSGVRVHLDLGGSPTLVQQIEQGAPADVFAAADMANMRKLVDAGEVETPTVFARNKLEIVVQKGNPKRVSALTDLARPDLVVVLAAPGVPAGAYALQALAKAGVKLTPKSQEQDVKSIVSKVALGEADAGIVYVTDVRAAGGRIDGVPIPDSENVIASYPLAVVKNAANAPGARLFDEYVLSTAGQKVLMRYGFAAP
jgi:molybdate transport system substrate-binding protein